MVGVGTREGWMWGGDPCGRPRPCSSIHSGGTKDTHKGPPVRSASTRVPTLWRVPRFLSRSSFPASVVKHHQGLGRKRPIISHLLVKNHQNRYPTLQTAVEENSLC